MTFLPIVDRELRLAARRRTTYLARIGTAALVILIFGGLQLTQAFRLGPFFTAGQTQFFVLKWLGFLFACSAGVFLTSDALSEEKREGTLGLLFLTDLNGFDVVLVASPGEELERTAEREGVRAAGVPMSRSVRSRSDLVSLARLVRLIKLHPQLLR